VAVLTAVRVSISDHVVVVVIDGHQSRRTRQLGIFLTRNDGDLVSLTDPGEIKFGVFLQSVLDVRSIS
jgi:hypothetical protein